MSPPDRPKGEFRSAQHEGTAVSATHPRASARAARLLAAPPTVCVVLHDVADATLAACERTLRAVAEVAPLPLTLLAVPRFHGRPASPTLEAWLQAHSKAGNELALHGLTHRDEGRPRGPVDWLRRRFYTRGEGEFWPLSAQQAAARLAAGSAWFDAQGWPLHGFVAPAWLLGEGAWAALRASGRFDYTATLQTMHLLGPGGASPRVQSRGVVYSSASAWRRASSVAWAAVNLASLRHNPLLRVELHPADADHAGIRRSWQGVLESALREREASTVSAWVQRWRRAQTVWTASGPADRVDAPAQPHRTAQAAIGDVADGTP